MSPTYMQKAGSKIANMRTELGKTQDEVSKLLGIPRSSYTQIELGNRNISTIELIKLSKGFGFSMANFLNEVFDIQEESKVTHKQEFNYEKFKSVFLYILNECKSKNNVGKVVLNNLTKVI